MPDNLYVLETVRQPVLPVDEELVRTLEMLLKDANAGEIQGILFVTHASDGAGSTRSIGTGWSGQGIHQNVHAALGGLTYLQNRFIEGKLPHG